MENIQITCQTIIPISLSLSFASFSLQMERKFSYERANQFQLQLYPNKIENVVVKAPRTGAVSHYRRSLKARGRSSE